MLRQFVTLRNVTAHARKSTGHFTACVKARADFSVGKQLHWSENSGAFMEGSEESCSSGQDPLVRIPIYTNCQKAF